MYYEIPEELMNTFYNTLLKLKYCKVYLAYNTPIIQKTL